MATSTGPADLWPAELWAAFSAAAGSLDPAVLALGAALLGAIAGFLALRLPLRRAEADAPALQTTDGAVFLFRGRDLRAANDAGTALLASLPEGSPPGERLLRWIAAAAPATVAASARALTDDSEPFTAHFGTPDGRSLELRGETRGALTALILRDTTAARRALIEVEARADRLETELRFLQDAVDATPVLLWRRRPGAGLLWTNAAYREEENRSGLEAPGQGRPLFAGLAEVGSAEKVGDKVHRRIGLNERGGERRWFDVAEEMLPEGDIIGSAQPADPIVRAEAALKRFVETLTETFAHLPIGLAVFDKNRRLGLFNPAITEILKLDPAWLAGRPTLRDFLERLRENRQMPDQKDFLAWRRKLTVLERDAEAASYEEDWVLPSGQTLRVIGRPHPQGAIAFLFEDISAAVTIERRYRAVIDTHRAVLHKFSEGVAIFAADGTLSYANTAFRGIWGFDPMQGDPAQHILHLVDRWSALCAPDPAWRDLVDFSTGRESRAPWTARLLPSDGRVLRLRAAPLPDGGTLVAFCDETDRERQAAALRERIADLETELDARFRRAEVQAEELDAALDMLAVLPDDPGSAAAGDDLRARLAAAVDLLRARLLAGPEEPAPPLRPRPAGEPDLAGCLDAGMLGAEARGIAIRHAGLEALGETGLPRGRLRQALFQLASEAVAFCPPGGTVTVVARMTAEGAVIEAGVPLPPDGAARAGALGFAGGLLDRILRRSGGELSLGIDTAAGRRVLVCRLPPAPRRGAEPGRSLSAG